jgi:hypothetical protein
MMRDRHEDATPYVLGAALAALVLPVMVLGLRAPLWLGVIGAVAALAAVVGAARLQRRRAAPDAVRGAQTPLDAALADAATALAQLEAAALGIRAFTTRVHVARIAEAARLIVDSVTTDPAALGAVQRVLTYYLPRAAAIAGSYRILEARGDADPARMARMEAIIARLDAAFRHYADRLADDALHLLDVELRLVDDALKDDLGDDALR